MTAQELKDLSEKYLNGTATQEERRLLTEWYTHGMDEQIEIATGHEDMQAMETALYEKIRQKIKVETPVRKMNWLRIAAAAAVLLILFFASSNYFTKRPADKDLVQATEHDIQAPSKNKAVITLSDGRRIILDSTGTGMLARQGDVNVSKSDDGQIVYSGTGNESLYNTLTNPRGSKVISIRLRDGTQVWLNAGSSLRYPITMSEKERKVEITGEAYFEVAHDAAKPFIVKNLQRDIQVQVLGTHFNINTYTDEPTADITLLEGSVKLVKGTATSLLKPGQQGRISSGIQLLTDVNMEQVMAWKNGYFQFNRDGLEVVMRQISRWYDVEVSYEGAIPLRQFGGKISRNNSIKDVFKILAINKVAFRIEGNKIIVMAK